MPARIQVCDGICTMKEVMIWCAMQRTLNASLSHSIWNGAHGTSHLLQGAAGGACAEAHHLNEVPGPRLPFRDA